MFAISESQFNQLLDNLLSKPDNEFREHIKESLKSVLVAQSKLFKQLEHKTIRKTLKRGRTIFNESRKYHLQESSLGQTTISLFINEIVKLIVLRGYYYPDKSSILFDLIGAIYIAGYIYVRGRLQNLMYDPWNALMFGIGSALGMIPITLLWMLMLFRTRYLRNKKSAERIEKGYEYADLGLSGKTEEQDKMYREELKQNQLLKRERIAELISMFVQTILSVLSSIGKGIFSKISTSIFNLFKALKIDKFILTAAGHLPNAEIRKEIIDYFKHLESEAKEKGERSIFAYPSVTYNIGLFIGSLFNVVAILAFAIYLDKRYGTKFSAKVFGTTLLKGIPAIISASLSEIIQFVALVLVVFTAQAPYGFKAVETNQLIGESNTRYEYLNESLFNLLKQKLTDSLKKLTEIVKKILRNVGQYVKTFNNPKQLKNPTVRRIVSKIGLYTLTNLIHFAREPKWFTLTRSIFQVGLTASDTNINLVGSSSKKYTQTGIVKSVEKDYEKTIEELKERGYDMTEEIELLEEPEIDRDTGRQIITKVRLIEEISPNYYTKIYELRREIELMLRQQTIINSSKIRKLLFTPIKELRVNESDAIKIYGALCAALIQQYQDKLNTKYKPLVTYIPTGDAIFNPPNAFSFLRSVTLVGRLTRDFEYMSFYDIAAVMAHELAHNYLQTRHTLSTIFFEIFGIITLVLPITFIADILKFTDVRLRLTDTLFTLALLQNHTLVSRTYETEADTIAAYILGASLVMFIKFVASISEELPHLKEFERKRTEDKFSITFKLDELNKWFGDTEGHTHYDTRAVTIIKLKQLLEKQDIKTLEQIDKNYQKFFNTFKKAISKAVKINYDKLVTHKPLDMFKRTVLGDKY